MNGEQIAKRADNCLIFWGYRRGTVSYDRGPRPVFNPADDNCYVGSKLVPEERVAGFRDDWREILALPDSLLFAAPTGEAILITRR